MSVCIIHIVVEQRYKQESTYQNHRFFLF